MKRVGKNSIAIGLAMLLISVALSFSAQGATTYESHATSQLISGDLEALANIQGAKADNDGSTPPVVDGPDDLDVTLLGAINIPLPGGINIDLNQLLGQSAGLQTGAIAQYAKANNDGHSRGATGAISNTGGVDFGNGSGSPKAAVIDLKKLVPGLDALLTGSLSIGAVTAVADLHARNSAELAKTCAVLADPDQCRDYNIAGLNMDLTIPAVKTLNDGVGTFYGTTLANSTNISIQAVCEALLGVGNIVCATISSSVATLDVHFPSLATLLRDVTKLGDGNDNGVVVDLTTGEVKVDVDKLLGSLPEDKKLDLNNIAPSVQGTAILARVLEAVPGAISGLVTEAVFGDGTDTNPGIVTRLRDLNTTYIELTLAGGAPVRLSLAQAAPLLDPLFTGLTTGLDTLKAPLATGLSEVGAGLSNAIELYVNRQFETAAPAAAGVQAAAASGTVYTQNALQLSLFDHSADVNLATATVGPNGVVPDAAQAAAAAAGDNQAAATAADGNQAAAGDNQAAAAAAGGNPDDAVADADVTTTLPNTGAPNILPLLFLALGLIAFGTAVLVNERRRLTQL